MSRSLLSLFGSVVLAAGVAACSATTEMDRYERATELIEARENFEALQQECQRSRGIMVIRPRSTRIRLDRYTTEDYLTAYCIRRF